jgi:hypothetical protein
VIVEPYKRAVPRRPVGLVTASRRVLIEDGSSVRLRDAPTSLALYADAHIVNQRFLRRGDGWAHAWNDRPVRWFCDLERQVILLQGFPGDGADVLAGLVRLRDYLYEHGARIGSPAASSFSLFRATVPGPMFLGGGRSRPRFRIVGGRQEAFVPYGVYGRFAHVDISAAYGRTLGALMYPPGGSWVKVPRFPDDPDVPCLVRAEVRVPAELAAGPLPVRPRKRAQGAAKLDELIEYPVGRKIRGLWTLAEIDGARDAGCDVKVREVHILLGGRYRPFERWWTVVEAARKLPGYAGELGKQLGNTLWGRFALDGVKTEDRYRDGRRVSSVVKGVVNPAFGAPDISELVASQVRTRLYRELIRPHADRLLSVHTDGGLIRADDLRLDVPKLPTGWRTKHTGEFVIYLGPQLYSYREDVRGDPVYVVSGISPDSAPLIFQGLCRSSFGWPPTVSPKIVGRERQRLERLMKGLR